MEHTFGDAESESENNLQSELSTVLRRSPVSVPPDAPIRVALEAMEQHRVGSIVIVDPETERPRGVFTLQDLLRRVALKGVDLEQPIADVMTRNLVTLRPHQTAHQAAVLMAQRNIRHVLVTDHQGHLQGVVSKTDLFSLQRAGVRELSDEITRAGDMRTLKAASDQIDLLAHTMLRKGVGAESLTHFISTLNDLLTLRIIELTEAEFDLPDIPWCWIALGSEGRYEQTLATDQDNGIIFSVPEGGDAGPIRARLLPFAQAVNKKLDECGFTLCKGNIMAGNPQWCLSLDEWKDCFGNWMIHAQPQALLNGAIFFDFRALHGDESLAESLRAWLNEMAPQQPVFLRLLAQNALDCQPPIGVIREFVYDNNKEHPHTIDLKTHGARLFVDAARIFALALGVPNTGTAQRLRGVAAKLAFAKDDIGAVIEGFYFIQTLRLRHQHRNDPSADAANRVNPEKLNELERHVLREAFKQAKKLQQRLALDYRL